MDLAFWFTFAGYRLVPGTGSRCDLDLASYGVVKMVPGGPGSGYQGLGWEPKLAFGALAQAGWRNSAGGDRGPVHYSLRYPGPRRGIARLRGIRSASEEHPHAA